MSIFGKIFRVMTFGESHSLSISYINMKKLGVLFKAFQATLLLMFNIFKNNSIEEDLGNHYSQQLEMKKILSPASVGSKTIPP